MITDTHAYRSAERAYENQNPYDDDCTCTEDKVYVCADCGKVSDVPDQGECEEPTCDLMEATDEEMQTAYPKQNCPRHGWCGGCSSPSCECKTP